MIKNYDEYIKEAKKVTDEQRARDIKVIEDNAASQIKATNDSYNKAISDTKTAYDGEYEKNEVQKIINEHMITEKNASLGLTDSGLNRTQQTAAQLSYSNFKGDISLARQRALDELNSNLAAAVAEINNQLESNKLSINQSYDAKNTEIATALYDNNFNSQYEYSGGTTYNNNQNKVFWYNTGAVDESGNRIFKNSLGETQAFGSRVNPYTYTINSDSKNGVFSNGYQPDNFNGTKLVDSGLETNITGKTQTIWMANGKYLLWRGDLNQYVEIDSSSFS